MNHEPTPSVAPEGPTLNLLRCYLKGMSLEMPHAPGIFVEQGQLALDLSLTLANQELSPGVVEVVVRGTLTAKLGEKVAYLIETEQAGIFEMRNIPLEHLGSVLNVTCPAIVYPYMRVLIADCISRTGLPVFNVPEVNWSAMYAQAAAPSSPLATLPTVGPVQ